MKKVLLFAAFAVVGLIGMNAQEDNESSNSLNDVVDMAKEGGFYVGANIGLPLAGVKDVASFNFGFDGAYLFGVIPNLEIGLLMGYSQFLGDGTYTYKNEDGDTVTKNYEAASFLPIAVSSRYYFNEHQFFAGMDLGYAINLTGDADGGLYARPKFGYDFGTITLIGSFTSISGGSNYSDNGNNSALEVSAFNTANVGIEFGF